MRMRVWMWMWMYLDISDFFVCYLTIPDRFKGGSGENGGMGRRWWG